MASRVPYAQVVEEALRLGWRNVYPNGAAFDLGGRPTFFAGWVTGDDQTVKPTLRDRVRVVAEGKLPGLVRQVWLARDEAPEAWVAPVHSWASELEHGHGQWLSPLVHEAGVAPEPLRTCRYADAIAFEREEADQFEHYLAGLLMNLRLTDHTLILPGVDLLGTIHHHRQMWFRSPDEAVANELLAMAE